jgi:integrase
MRLLLLSGAREMEVADISVGEIDRGAGLWRIPPERAKNEQPLTLPLGPLALAELAVVWPAEPVPDGWKLLRVRGFSKLKAKIDQLSGITEPWRLHDLRRSVRTGLARLGVPRDHAEAVLNHISGRTALERTYDRYSYCDEVLAASLRWQSHVETLVTERPSAEVISLARSG